MEATPKREEDEKPGGGCCGPAARETCCGPEDKAECCGSGDGSTCGCRKHPVAVIGAGPVGLAAAAHLVARGETPLVLEAGPGPGASIRKWGHVRIFSPWRTDVDDAAVALLESHGWTAPPPEQHPTGRELVERYLEPLAALPEIRPHLRFGTRVLGVSRRRGDRTRPATREREPFVLRVEENGVERDVLARAVIDASGTYATPNPLGSNGLPALGEAAAQERIFYGIPDVLGRDRQRYAGKRVLVVGSGHSAFGTLLDLADLRDAAPATAVVWAVRRPNLDRVFGSGDGDGLVERGRLGSRMRALAAEGALEVVTGLQISRVSLGADGVSVASEDRELPPVDEVVAATGFRPDLSLLGEVRLGLDDALQSPQRLAPLIDPKVHSCGSVPPHGFRELAHPEPDFYVVGMKSYGRAPTFLMRTGYEQVRSVVAALAGDLEAAKRVELELPKSGACSTGASDAPSACCGTPAAEPNALPPRAARAETRVAAGCC